jgi:hypothetical protein
VEQVAAIMQIFAPFLAPTTVIFLINFQNNLLGKEIKNSNDALSKDIKNSNDALSKDIDVLSKDIKFTNELLNKLIIYSGKKDNIDLGLFINVVVPLKDVENRNKTAGPLPFEG